MSNELWTAVVARVSRWPGVRRHRDRNGHVALLVGGAELGVVGPDGGVTLPVPPAVRDQLLTEGMADRHDEPGRVAYRVVSAADLPGMLRLLRLVYLCHLLSLSGRPTSPAPALDPRRELANLDLSPGLHATVLNASVPDSGPEPVAGPRRSNATPVTPRSTAQNVLDSE